MKTIFSLLGSLMFAAAAVSVHAAGDKESEAIERALEAARADAGVPFGLDVACRDGDRHRAARVYPGGVGAWDRTVQVRVDEAIREALVGDLLDAGFARFEPRYGGQDKPEKAEAPLRILCRITVRAGGLEKMSVQAAYGEQSAVFMRLATTLLDRLEPLAADGVTAPGLDEALGMLARGELAPEMLSLRLLRLPAGSGDEAPGAIVRLDGLRRSQQPYQPGKTIGSANFSEASPESAARIAAEASSSGFASLPVNVAGTGYTELEIEALGHSKTVIARDFTRAAAGAESARFEQLVEVVLSELGTE